jgi:hypothetical protein
MAFENSAGIDVSNHYGPRPTGGTDGSHVTHDNVRQYVFDLDGDKIADLELSVTQSGVVRDVRFDGTAGTATIEINSTDVTDATYALPVAFTAGDIVVTVGTGTGKAYMTVEFDAA